MYGAGRVKINDFMKIHEVKKYQAYCVHKKRVYKLSLGNSYVSFSLVLE